MVDRRSNREVRESLESVWRELGRTLAVAAGALTAFCSLMFHVPVWVASMRGAIVFVALSLVNRASSAALSWTQPKRPASTPRRTP